MAVSAAAEPRGPGGEIVAWNVADMREVWRQDMSGQAPAAVAVHSTESVLAVAARDGTVRLHDAGTGHELRRLKAHSGEATAVAFGPGPDRLVTGGADRAIRVWDWRTGQPLLTLSGCQEQVRSVAVSSDGRMIAASTGQVFLNVNEVRVWEADSTVGLARYRNPAAIADWRRAEAEAAVGGQNWTGALFHLDPLLTLNGDDPQLQLVRGKARVGLGRFADAETDFRRAAELKPGWGEPLFELGELLGARSRRWADAVLAMEAGFAADPNAADTPRSGHRYNAACFAARASAGDGIPVEARAGYRRKALEWLRADLKTQTGTTQPALRQVLTHWLTDEDLVGVRDSAALAALPAAERAEWDAFWADVRATITGVQKPPPPRPEIAPPPRAVTGR
jgi:hypothetical protein